MSQIKVLKEPAFIYDLLFLFYLKFNTRLCISNLGNNESHSENVQYFNDLLEQFSDISDDLFVFFHATQSGRCFIISRYFESYKELFTSNFNFRFLQNELTDKDRFIRNLVQFYFPNISDEETEEYVSSNVSLFSCVKNSQYSDEEKSRLYEFFINPEPYMQTLQYELMAKELILSQYYERNYQKIFDAQNQTTYEILSEQMKGLVDSSCMKKTGQEIYTSYCLINKFCVNMFPIQEGVLYLLGYDYYSVLDLGKGEKKNFNLQDLGDVLCEESRVKILQLLLEREEVTRKDLEKHFSFSGSTAYHHMTIMIRVGLVKTRNEGKTILYSLNRRYFDAIIGVLSDFSSKYKLENKAI